MVCAVCAVCTRVDVCMLRATGVRGEGVYGGVVHWCAESARG